MVKVLPEPVTPSSTWLRSCWLTPATSSAMAVGWSPLGSQVRHDAEGDAALALLGPRRPVRREGAPVARHQRVRGQHRLLRQHLAGALGALVRAGQQRIEAGRHVREVAGRRAGVAQGGKGGGDPPCPLRDRSPSPLWGGVRGGGNPDRRCSAIPPSLSLPHIVGACLRHDGGGDARGRGGEKRRARLGKAAGRTPGLRRAGCALQRRCRRLSRLAAGGPWAGGGVAGGAGHGGHIWRPARDSATDRLVGLWACCGARGGIRAARGMPRKELIEVLRSGMDHADMSP